MVQFLSTQLLLPLDCVKWDFSVLHIMLKNKSSTARTCINNPYPQAEIPVLQPRCCCVKKTVIIASQEESPHLGGHPWLHFFSLLAVFASSFVHTSPNSTAQVPRLELGSLWRKHVIKLQRWVGQLARGARAACCLIFDHEWRWHRRRCTCKILCHEGWPDRL